MYPKFLFSKIVYLCPLHFVKGPSLEECSMLIFWRISWINCFSSGYFTFKKISIRFTIVFSIRFYKKIESLGFILEFWGGIFAITKTLMCTLHIYWNCFYALHIASTSRTERAQGCMGHNKINKCFYFWNVMPSFVKILKLCWNKYFIPQGSPFIFERFVLTFF